MAALRNPADFKPHPKLGPGGILPGLTDEEYAGLKASIEADGIMQPIVVAVPEKVIIDGHHRHRIALELGMEQVPVMLQEFGDDAAHLRLGLSLNFDRRHLTGEQKRAAAAALLKEDPAQSDRSIAAAVGMSATTVGAVRTDLEDAGDVSKMDTRTDTTGRKQPARKPRPTGSIVGKKKPAKPKHETPEEAAAAIARAAEKRRSEGTTEPASARETRAETQDAREPVAPPSHERATTETHAPPELGTTGAPVAALSSEAPPTDADLQDEFLAAAEGAEVQPCGAVVVFVRAISLPDAGAVEGLTDADLQSVREMQAWCGKVIAAHARAHLRVG